MTTIRNIFLSIFRQALKNNWWLFHHSKFLPRTGHEGPKGQYMYICTLSLTSALSGVGGQSYAPAAVPLGMNRYALYFITIYLAIRHRSQSLPMDPLKPVK